MTELPPLTARDFPAVFEAVHGRQPFPWQTALAEQVCREGRWPDQLDLPTGAGKTAALDIALFHLAVEADKGPKRRAPLRIALVVDRRLVVDDAYDRAQCISAAVSRAAPGTVLGSVQARLQALSGAGYPPVVARRLRGGLPMEGDWARTPCQPLLVSSTVDQIGSRLLFRGYGVSDRMKPVHAGLIGSDCLILLDEAHLSEPFRQTLGWVELNRKRQASATGMADPWGYSVLTATPGFKAERPFRLTSRELGAPKDGPGPESTLRRRMLAGKPAELVDKVKDLAGALADKAVEFREALQSAGIPAPAIGVVVNRVALAREVFERLRAPKTNDAGQEPSADIVLLIGPSRPLDRDEIVEKALQPIYTGAPRTLERPLVVVATQCVEVGVDLDLDGLVTQCAALDALRQRFGRLNRNGRAIKARAAILVGHEDLSRRARADGDAVYGKALAATWDWLQEHADAGTIDFGIEAMNAPVEQAKAEGRFDDLITAKLNAPALSPALVDILAQTSPIPKPDIDISLCLHGPQRASATVSLVWRADLTPDDIDPSKAERCRQYVDTLAHLPPRTGEMMSLPVGAARAWLAGKGKASEDVSDVAEVAAASEEVANEAGRRVLRWCGADSERTRSITAAEVRPGDVLVVPAECGGCDEFGWNPSYKVAVCDVADRAAMPYRHRRFAFRLHPGLANKQEDEAAPTTGEPNQRLAAKLEEFLAEVLEASPREMISALNSSADGLGLPARLIAELKGKSRQVRLIWRGVDGDGPLALTIATPRCLPRDTEASGGADEAELANAPSSTESDEQGNTSERPLDLDTHCALVEQHAKEFAMRLGVSRSLEHDLSVAAYLHDAGKIDPRFQAWLAGGNIWETSDRVLAKSQRGSGAAASRPTELPAGWRHEALSVCLSSAHPRFGDVGDKDLVLYLIGTHHGFGRPWFPHADPKDGRQRAINAPCLGRQFWSLAEDEFGPQDPRFDYVGRDWAALVASLNERYGPWRLAHLETILRLADHRASAEVDLKAAAPDGTAGAAKAEHAA